MVRRAAPARATPADIPGQRELLAVREIVHSFLYADRPEEAFQFALDRVGPVVGASLASVYLVEGASELMRLAAVHNWPEQHRPWLADVRVRVGFGPSGEAASERRVIEVPDIFADPDLEDWQDIARELGFSAIVSLPLQSAASVLGAVTFYFKNWDDFTLERRGLLRLVADLMAGAAEKSHVLDRVRRAEAAAADAQNDLERQQLLANESRRALVEFVASAVTALRYAVEGAADGEPGLSRARALVDDLALIVAVDAGTAIVTTDTFDPRVPLREAMRAVAADYPEAHLTAEEPIHALPPLHTDMEKVALILARLLARAVKATVFDGVEIRATIGATRDRVEYRVPGTSGDDVRWRFAAGVSRLLGASLETESGPAGSMVVLALPVMVERTETN